MAVRAIQISGQRFADQAFDLSFVGFVLEFGVIRGRCGALSLSFRFWQKRNSAPQDGNHDNEKNGNESFHGYRLGCLGNFTQGKRTPRTKN